MIKISQFACSIGILLFAPVRKILEEFQQIKRFLISLENHQTQNWNNKFTCLNNNFITFFSNLLFNDKEVKAYDCVYIYIYIYTHIRISLHLCYASSILSTVSLRQLTGQIFIIPLTKCISLVHDFRESARTRLCSSIRWFPWWERWQARRYAKEFHRKVFFALQNSRVHRNLDAYCKMPIYKRKSHGGKFFVRERE